MTSPPAPEEFQVGWICALPIEAAAAIQMLDENFGILQDQDRADTNTYTLGRIGHHYVAIACLPDGQYGTASATIVANNVMHTFSKSLRIGLMVGIGGGIPSPDHDIRLGDIVVSRPDGSCGGVVQHDMGKIGKDGKIQRIGALNTPPRSLLTALGQMKAAELYKDPLYVSYIQQVIERNARTRRNFGRPDLQTDRLFRIECDHLAGAPTCDRCPAEWEETRLPREESEPRTHYGIIASGNTVIKHAATRERIGKETGALCLEMEAAGLMADFPCIVIRGVCDYADSHKNKQWQGYAALTAAAYAKEFLTYIPRGVLSQEKLLADVCATLEDVKKSLEEGFHQRESHHRERVARMFTEDQRRCHQAFKTSTYEQHKNINPDRVEGTCEWVLKRSEYLNWWKATNNDLLWISADPGCGKSVLAKSLVDNIFKASDPIISICYFFFKDNDEQNSLANALCSILHQLFGLQPQLLQHALPSWEKNQNKIQREVDELWRILMAAMSDPASVNTICVFDALDECRKQDRNQLIHKLESFYVQTGSSTQRSWLKFLVTSRPYDDIQDSFRPVTKSFPKIHLRGEEENDQIHEEISLVVNIRVSELGESLNLSAKTQARLEKELLQMEHRTYLWLYLAIDDIRTMFQDSLRPDEESVRLIPKSVNAAYKKILSRVTPEQDATVRTILQIIVGARRPLTIREMAMALGVATSKRAQRAAEAALNPETLGEKIRRICGLFVFINDSKIYLIHQTAREFLLANKLTRTSGYKWHFKSRDVEVEMTRICVNYLLMDDLVDHRQEKTTQSFLDYSAQNWSDHFREISSPEPELLELVYQLYDVNSERFALWFPVFWESARPHENNPRMNALHLAAFNGHDDVICRLVMNGRSTIGHPDSTGMNALQWASLRGHHKSTQILLESGAGVNARGGEYGNALQAASFGGHVCVIRQLLEKGADVNAQSGEYDNALQAASSEGHLDTVQLLVEKGANVNAQSGKYGNALYAASSRGYIAIVRQLLDKGANTNIQSGSYGNALQAACSIGHLEIVQLLLEKGADVNAQSGYYGNALYAACSKGHVDIVQQLLKKGADVNAQGGQHGNALYAASYGGHLEIVQLLLEKRVDVNTQSGSYGNALQAACSIGHLEIVQILLEKGADVNAQSRSYGNALYAASYGGYLEIVQLLLEKGADFNAQSGSYGNALYAACSKGHVDIVQQLLKKGADVNTHGGQYGDALYLASERGDLMIVQHLLEKGADVNAQSGYYGNALQAASLGGHIEIVQQLLEKGADVNAQGGYYANALYPASFKGHINIVQQLLEKGANVNAQGGSYGNALQVASSRGHFKVVQQLLENGADVNAQVGHYGTALEIASSRGHLDIVQLLIGKESYP